LGITTAAGVVTGIAGLGLQGASYSQATKQIEDQEEIIKLQKKLAEYQLKQYQDQEKEMNNIFKTPTNIGGGMMTRSMSHANNLQRTISNANNFGSNSSVMWE
jgi:hypothetical protein